MKVAANTVQVLPGSIPHATKGLTSNGTLLKPPPGKVVWEPCPQQFCGPLEGGPGTLPSWVGVGSLHNIHDTTGGSTQGP